MKVFLAQDGSCHWYLVEAEHRAHWQAWVESDDDPETPDYAQELCGSVSAFEFDVDKDWSAR